MELVPAEAGDHAGVVGAECAVGHEQLKAVAAAGGCELIAQSAVAGDAPGDGDKTDTHGEGGGDGLAHEDIHDRLLEARANIRKDGGVKSEA